MQRIRERKLVSFIPWGPASIQVCRPVRNRNGGVPFRHLLGCGWNALLFLAACISLFVVDLWPDPYTLMAEEKGKGRGEERTGRDKRG